MQATDTNPGSRIETLKTALLELREYNCRVERDRADKEREAVREGYISKAEARCRTASTGTDSDVSLVTERLDYILKPSDGAFPGSRATFPCQNFEWWRFVGVQLRALGFL